MFKKRFFPLFSVAALLAVNVPATAADPGNIVFIGDSITQGGQFLKGRVPGYRYQLFKNFVDNNVEFSPMGMTTGAARNVDVSALTPDYRGKTFPNVSEAAASGRAYQYSGHPAKDIYRGDPGTAFPPQNRGPVTIKLGQPDSFTKSETAYFDGKAEKKYTGETYKSRYGSKKVDTLCVMIGINDLYDAREPNEKIAEHVHRIVKAYQKHNPKVRVHLFELLPTGANNGTGTNNKNNYAPYNAHLKSVAKKWSSGKSVVSVHDIAQGFYAEDGSMIDGIAGAHPNAQGELIVAGNIARVLGVGQRTAGLKRRAIDGNVANQKLSSKSKPLTYKLKPVASEKGRESTVYICAKLKAGKENDNFVDVFVCGGNGQIGRLFIGESGIYWNDTGSILYGSKSKDSDKKIFTQNQAEITVAWKKDDNASGKGGFYVWLGEQLIGENLQGASDPALADSLKNRVTIGNVDEQGSLDAVVSAVGVCDDGAFAPATSRSSKKK